jgi:hypothetical protein
MSTADSSPSSNGRGSEAWSRPWAHISLDRRSAGYCRVTFDHPPINTITATMTLPADSEFPPALADFFELVGRPGQQEQSARLGRARVQHRQRLRAASRAARRGGERRRLSSGRDKLGRGARQSAGQLRAGSDRLPSVTTTDGGPWIPGSRAAEARLATPPADELTAPALGGLLVPAVAAG